jgi:RNA polymerase sigma-70 factor (ECF subfamily)
VVRSGRVTAAGDDELVARATAGDRRALETLLDRHTDRVHAICRRIVLDPEDALDATQEALIAIARGITRFDGRAAFTTWLHRVATNTALDELRRRKRRVVTTEARGDLTDPGASSVEQRVAARLDVDAALARVPEDFRVAVVLRDLCDLDYPEIAQVLEVPVGTVKSRIARGRQALSTLLGNAAGNQGDIDDVGVHSD